MKPVKKPRRRARRSPPADGYYWEEWRAGRLIASGYHDGSSLSGQDASMSQTSLRQAIPASVLQQALYER